MGNTGSAGTREIICCRSRGEKGDHQSSDDPFTNEFYGGDEFDFENGLGPSH